MSELQPRYRPSSEQLPVDTDEQKTKELDRFYKRFTISGYAFALSLISFLAAIERVMHTSDGKRADTLILLGILAGGVGIGSYADATRKAVNLTHTLYKEREKHTEDLRKKDKEIQERDRRIAAYGLDNPSENEFIE